MTASQCLFVQLMWSSTGSLKLSNGQQTCNCCDSSQFVKHFLILKLLTSTSIGPVGWGTCCFSMIVEIQLWHCFDNCWSDKTFHVNIWLSEKLFSVSAKVCGGVKSFIHNLISGGCLQLCHLNGIIRVSVSAASVNCNVLHCNKHACSCCSAVSDLSRWCLQIPRRRISESAAAEAELLLGHQRKFFSCMILLQKANGSATKRLAAKLLKEGGVSIHLLCKNVFQFLPLQTNQKDLCHGKLKCSLLRSTTTCFSKCELLAQPEAKGL